MEIQKLILSKTEIVFINYLSAPVKVHSNDDSFNNSNSTANTKFMSKHNGSYIAKIDEVTLNNLQ